jgi:hypothetical protein
MIVFFVISSIVISLSKSEKTDHSKITLYNNEAENMAGYKAASESVLRRLENACVNQYVSCSSHGVCNASNTACECDKGYATFPVENFPQCNYQQKKQIAAFLYEFFLGFGAGHFYCERYTNAGLKLSAFIFGIYIICLLPLSAKFINDRCESEYLTLAVSCLYYMCAVALAFWFIYDLVMFGLNKYEDGNGIRLGPWGS